MQIQVEAVKLRSQSFYALTHLLDPLQREEPYMNLALTPSTEHIDVYLGTLLHCDTPCFYEAPRP